MAKDMIGKKYKVTTGDGTILEETKVLHVLASGGAPYAYIVNVKPTDPEMPAEDAEDEENWTANRVHASSKFELLEE